MIITNTDTKESMNVTGKYFAYDGCHKIYIIEDATDMYGAHNLDYDVYPISELEVTYNNSCPLRFINNWKLDKTYAPQFCDVVFDD